ncbi:unnamed protein product [Symbiodinium natans]|uniref:Class I SAM-dependent methyltransferase n=1 Tax=Symbiodinium natans TaxID=878477 RepID=A0A812NSJ7_9DINO|nr:unnamed protein product [Symbiodinium natans]
MVAEIKWELYGREQRFLTGRLPEDAFKQWNVASPQDVLLQNVGEVAMWLYANIQVLASERRTFKSFSGFQSEVELPAAHRYASGPCQEAALKLPRQLQGLFSTYRDLFDRALARSLWNTTAGAGGVHLVQQAAIKLREAPGRALAAFGNRGFDCKTAGRVVRDFAQYFRRFAVDAFLHLSTGAVCNTSFSDGRSRLVYHESRELDLRGHYRGYVLEHLLKSLLQGDATLARAPCLRAVEIGTFSAMTSEYLLRMVPCLQLWCIDPLPQRVAWSRLSKFRNRSTLWKIDSSAGSTRVEDGSMDLVFVDGDHSYEGAASDIFNWEKKLRPGGILAGHDFNGIFPGVVRAIEEFVQLRQLTLHLATDYMWWTFKGA